MTFDGQMRFKMDIMEQLVIQQSAYCVPFVRWQHEKEEERWANKLDKTLKWNKQIVQKPLTKIRPRSYRAKL